MKSIIKYFIIASVVPIGILALLFWVAEKRKIKTYKISRTYSSHALKIKKIFDNPGINQVRKFNGQLFASDFKSIYAVDSKDMRITKISDKSSQPIIGWGMANQLMYITFANTFTIYKLDSGGNYTVIKKLEQPLRRMSILNDSALILKCMDSDYKDDDFYRFSIRSKYMHKVYSKIRKYADGGFANDGYFLEAGNVVIYLRFNMGKFSVIDKRSGDCIDTLNTIDHNNEKPKVVQFAVDGFMLDKKYERTNRFGFANAKNLFVCTNAYSSSEYYSGLYKSNYIIDIYSLADYLYRTSIKVPRDNFKYGPILDGIAYNNQIILIYLKKIIELEYETY